MPQQTLGFAVLVPVKSPAIGKSRLSGIADRERLARAIATDTIRAARAASSVRRVLVITDSTFAPVAAGLGVEVVTDPGTGLNGALRAGAASLRERGSQEQPVALLADLPALTPAQLDEALGQVGHRPSYCADAEGTGTTLYTAPYDDFDPHFGVDSAAAHAATGAVAVHGELAGLRRDVDDPASLAAAVALGVGPATAELMRPS